MKSESFTQSQVTILGFGMELGDSLNRYATWKLSDSPNLVERAKSLVERDYLAWFHHCPYHRNICFADLTFFSPDQVSLHDALTIVFTAENPGQHTQYSYYIRVLREYLDGGRGHTMAPHAVFAAGLPRILNPGPDDPRNPEVESDLNPFFESIQAKQRSDEVTSGFFWAQTTLDSSAEVETPDEMKYAAMDMVDGTYDKTEFTGIFAERVSRLPISRQFQAWFQIWVGHAREMCSAAGRPIRHIVAAPIGFRNPNNVAEYEPVACVFLAMDTGVDDAAVVETLRYMFLHVLEANATSWLLRKGDLIGQDAAVVPASHELSRIISAIRPGASSAAYRLLQSYFRQLLIDPADIVARARRDKSAKKVKFYDIKRVVTDALSLAGKIEAIVEMTNQATDNISNLSAESFDARIASEVASIMDSLRLPPQLEAAVISCTLEQSHWFYLAVLAACRNAVRHSIRKGRPTFYCDVDKSVRGSFLLTNAFDTSGVQRDDEGKPTGGTLKALRGYVRAFGKDPRRVSLKRISSGKSGEDLLKFHESWLTTIPLPGDL